MGSLGKCFCFSEQIQAMHQLRTVYPAGPVCHRNKSACLSPDPTDAHWTFGKIKMIVCKSQQMQRSKGRILLCQCPLWIILGNLECQRPHQPTLLHPSLSSNKGDSPDSGKCVARGSPHVTLQGKEPEPRKEINTWVIHRTHAEKAMAAFFSVDCYLSNF